MKTVSWLFSAVLVFSLPASVWAKGEFEVPLASIENTFLPLECVDLEAVRNACYQREVVAIQKTNPQKAAEMRQALRQNFQDIRNQWKNRTDRSELGRFCKETSERMILQAECSAFE
jgi:hypothetical protein